MEKTGDFQCFFQLMIWQCTVYTGQVNPSEIAQQKRADKLSSNFHHRPFLCGPSNPAQSGIFLFSFWKVSLSLSLSATRSTDVLDYNWRFCLGWHFSVLCLVARSHRLVVTGMMAMCKHVLGSEHKSAVPVSFVDVSRTYLYQLPRGLPPPVADHWVLLHVDLPRSPDNVFALNQLAGILLAHFDTKTKLSLQCPKTATTWFFVCEWLLNTCSIAHCFLVARTSKRVKIQLNCGLPSRCRAVNVLRKNIRQPRSRRFVTQFPFPYRTNRLLKVLTLASVQKLGFQLCSSGTDGLQYWHKSRDDATSLHQEVDPGSN